MAPDESSTPIQIRKYPRVIPRGVEGKLVNPQLIPCQRNRIGAVWIVGSFLPHVEHYGSILVVDPNVERIPITWNFPAFDFLVVGIKGDDNQYKVIRRRCIRPVRIITAFDDDWRLANRKSSRFQNLSRSHNHLIAIPDLSPSVGEGVRSSLHRAGDFHRTRRSINSKREKMYNGLFDCTNFYVFEGLTKVID